MRIGYLRGIGGAIADEGSDGVTDDGVGADADGAVEGAEGNICGDAREAEPADEALLRSVRNVSGSAAGSRVRGDEVSQPQAAQRRRGSGGWLGGRHADGAQSCRTARTCRMICPPKARTDPRCSATAPGVTCQRTLSTSKLLNTVAPQLHASPEARTFLGSSTSRWRTLSSIGFAAGVVAWRLSHLRAAAAARKEARGYRPWQPPVAPAGLT